MYFFLLCTYRHKIFFTFSSLISIEARYILSLSKIIFYTCVRTHTHTHTNIDIQKNLPVVVYILYIYIFLLKHTDTYNSQAHIL